jgi:cytochrome c oxidase cbb3-type subunit 3
MHTILPKGNPQPQAAPQSDLGRIVAMAETKPNTSQGELLDHQYDGIQEYDNPCPGWWKWLFFLSALFAPFYFFYFHIGKAGITIAKDHENAVANNVRLRFAEIGELTPDEPTMIKYMQKPEWLQVGRSVYEQKCKSCHGEGGRGLVGPNLTDDYYKNVAKLTDIPEVVTKGAGNGSMPAWNRLHPNEVVLVSAYVAGLRGEQLAGGREPEGKEIPPWPTETSDSAAEVADDDQAEPPTDNADSKSDQENTVEAESAKTQ